MKRMLKIVWVGWPHDDLLYRPNSPINAMIKWYRPVWHYPEFPSRQMLNSNHIVTPERRKACRKFQLQRKIMLCHWSLLGCSWTARNLWFFDKIRWNWVIFSLVEVDMIKIFCENLIFILFFCENLIFIQFFVDFFLNTHWFLKWLDP